MGWWKKSEGRRRIEAARELSLKTFAFVRRGQTHACAFDRQQRVEVDTHTDKIKLHRRLVFANLICIRIAYVGMIVLLELVHAINIDL